MKRDWDLIRKLLSDIEEDRDVLAKVRTEPKMTDQPLEEYDQHLEEFNAESQRIGGHLEMLIDNGYINGLTVRRSGNGFCSYSVFIPRLTMAGHDLLDTMRSATIWESIKSTAKTKGIELTFDSIKALGAFALKQLIG